MKGAHTMLAVASPPVVAEIEPFEIIVAPRQGGQRWRVVQDSAPSARPSSSRAACSARRNELLCFVLLHAESALWLLIPLLWGLAVNDWFMASARGLEMLGAAALVSLFLGLWQQAGQNRAVIEAYALQRSESAIQRRQRGGEMVFRPSARDRRQDDAFRGRSTRGTEVRLLYATIGPAVMLAAYDVWLAAGGLLFLIPALALRRLVRRRGRRLRRLLGEEIERQQRVISRGVASEIRGHFCRVGHWQVRMANWQACSAGMARLLGLVLVVGAMIRLATLPSASAGDFCAVLGYALMWGAALGTIAQPQKLEPIEADSLLGP